MKKVGRPKITPAHKKETLTCGLERQEADKFKRIAEAKGTEPCYLLANVAREYIKKSKSIEEIKQERRIKLQQQLDKSNEREEKKRLTIERRLKELKK